MATFPKHRNNLLIRFTPLDRFLLVTTLGSLSLVVTVNIFDIVLAHWVTLANDIAINVKTVSIAVIAVWFWWVLKQIHRYEPRKQPFLSAVICSCMTIAFCGTAINMYVNLLPLNLIWEQLSTKNLICEHICPDFIWFDFLEKREEFLDHIYSITPEIPGENT